MIDIKNTAEEVMKGLKDFQKATVERIDWLFRNGQRRVLVADEVGMGKTLIARGVIAKTALIRKEEQDDLFKVVYICSNQTIANQNIRKLNVTGEADIEDISDTRLSMQHLKITEKETDPKVKEGFIQLIPLTFGTSFSIKGKGTVQERALMYAILSHFCSPLAGYKTELEELMSMGTQSWVGAKEEYEKRVQACFEKTKEKYPANVIQEILKSNQKGMLEEHLKQMKEKTTCSVDNPTVIEKLRVMFAQISASMLQADLVIMDEFQNFKFLLNQEDEAESSAIEMVKHQFLECGDPRILLLSATPYKLYSTMEDLKESHSDEDKFWEEFLQIMAFLFKKKTDEKNAGQEKTRGFQDIWNEYSVALRELNAENMTVLQIKKMAAENAMYAGVCRTERISVMDSGDYTDDSDVKSHLVVNEKDIQSYIQMGTVLKNTESQYSLSTDYVKSCPYLMSFMNQYQLKKNIESYYGKQKDGDNIEQVNQELLWLDRKTVNDYKELPAVNARLERLKEKAFMGGAENYLWVPPSMPYYELEGVYKNSQEFSKILVFSSWKMVPRMIGTMLSYEAEQRTIGKFYEKKEGEKVDGKKAGYFAESRYPGQRLRFNLEDGKPGKPRGMSLFTLLYPSKFLSDLYDPIQSLNNHKTEPSTQIPLTRLEYEIRSNLSESPQYLALKEYEDSTNPGTDQRDQRWYYLAPMLLDGIGYTNQWMNMKQERKQEDGLDGENGQKGFLAHVNKLRENLKALEAGTLKLGKMPKDLLDTLVHMVLGSPAVCIYRSNGHNMQRATELARVFCNNFNLIESTAIVDLAYEGKAPYWQKVLKYCKDGCFQAMFDEYKHILGGSVGLCTDEAKKEEIIHKQMMESLTIRTATYRVDTFQSFCGRVKQKEPEKETQEGTTQQESKSDMFLRAHYAKGLIQDAGDDKEKVKSQENVRNAFNSPMRPFVLASTSIGQEGLDFHNYCRRIMHWNLPSNPVDLEQREGRVNRYKCHAIRQNVAQEYGNILFKSDIWSEMFEAAKAERQEGQSELVPFWCFGKNQRVKIERIVPMYPMSKDEMNYERLIKKLSLYRLTMGQPRQEELLEYLFREFSDESALKKLKDLFINLSPFSKGTAPSLQ